MKSGPVSAERLSGAFNMLSRPTNEAAISRGFATITTAAKKDPDEAFAKLGEIIKTKTSEELQAATTNIRKISFIRLILEGAAITQKARTVHPKPEDYSKSAKTLQEKYPEMIAFLKDLLKPKSDIVKVAV